MTTTEVISRIAEIDEERGALRALATTNPAILRRIGYTYPQVEAAKVRLANLDAEVAGMLVR